MLMLCRYVSHLSVVKVLLDKLHRSAANSLIYRTVISGKQDPNLKDEESHNLTVPPLEIKNEYTVKSDFKKCQQKFGLHSYISATRAGFHDIDFFDSQIHC